MVFYSDGGFFFCSESPQSIVRFYYKLTWLYDCVSCPSEIGVIPAPEAIDARIEMTGRVAAL